MNLKKTYLFWTLFFFIQKGPTPVPVIKTIQNLIQNFGPYTVEHN
jgi:hypothetical protein